MLLLVIHLLPAVLTLTVRGPMLTKDYRLFKDYNSFKITLVSVNRNSPNDLNLSNLGIELIDQNVFDRSNNLKTLNLANNALRSLPKFVFASLTNLEHLNLANNDLEEGGFYDGLRSLKTLNISNNKIRVYEPGHFYGLPKFTNILLLGMEFVSICAAMFENPLNKMRRPERRGLTEYPHTPELHFEIDIMDVPNTLNQNGRYKIQVCIKDGHLQSVEYMKKTLGKDCREVELTFGTLDLSSMGIRTFESGWYRLQDYFVTEIYFNDNEIDQLTKELLSDLPRGIHTVSLEGNKIERLKRGILKSENQITMLDLSRNRISEIEDGAFSELNLTRVLDLTLNRLNNTKFLDSLPLNIQIVSLMANEISELSAGDFSRFPRFRDLYLDLNEIRVAKAQRLRDFSSLATLSLMGNDLRKIELHFFQEFKNLHVLVLAKNKLSNLQKGVFSGLEKITEIRLGANELVEISDGVFTGLPDSFSTLDLSDNNIKILRAGTFVNVPRFQLDLAWNKVSKIEKGSFNLPNLYRLMLNGNSLTEIDGDMFDALGGLGELYLYVNGITTIKKGTTKNLNQLHRLDLDNNPIKILENGALAGLSKNVYTDIDLRSVFIHTIQSGLFDDV